LLFCRRQKEKTINKRWKERMNVVPAAMVRRKRQKGKETKKEKKKRRRRPGSTYSFHNKRDMHIFIFFKWRASPSILGESNRRWISFQKRMQYQRYYFLSTFGLQYN
jgi:hypothetical protein